MLANIIIEGSSDKAHRNLRQALADSFARGTDEYPVTPSQAQKLLQQYKVKPKKNNNNNKDNRNPNGNESKDADKSNKEDDAAVFVTKDTATGETNVEDKVDLFMSAVDEDIKDQFSFLQIHHSMEYGDDESVGSDSLGSNPPPLTERTDYDSSDSESERESDFEDFEWNDEQNWYSPDVLAVGSDSPPGMIEILEDRNATVTEADSLKTCLEFWKTPRWKIPGPRRFKARGKIPSRKEDYLCGLDDLLGHDANVDLTKAYMFAQGNAEIVNPNWILLDSQASCNVICNAALVKNIRPHPMGKKINIHCNAGCVTIGMVADLDGFGLVWFHPRGIANCLSLALVSDVYRVTLDTAVAQAFFVHKPDGSTRRFDRVSCDLYASDVSDDNGAVLAITTVDGQKRKYSDLDVRRATAARKLQDTLGYPSVKAFLKMIDNNLILNCPVTRRDITIAEDIFGTNTNIVKGKAVRQQPGHVREDLNEVPQHILQNYKDITLAIDIYHINGIKFLRSISRHIMFRMTIAIRDARASTMLRCVESMMGIYHTRGFKVKQIHGDNEFSCLSDRLSSQHGVTFHPVARGAHEPFIERDNRTSKERARCTYSGVPFERMPPRMVIELVMGVDFWLNSWCSKGGVSDTLSPREILTGIKLDANRHCKFQFGDYILSHNETDNTMRARANDAIYMRPTGSRSGGFYALDLKTGQRVHRQSATLAHMTDTVIERVHSLAKEKGAPFGLQFSDINNNTTILDLDTTPQPDSDDDASDGSFNPDDARSVDTELTGIITESSDSTTQVYINENARDNEAEAPTAGVEQEPPDDDIGEPHDDNGPHVEDRSVAEQAETDALDNQDATPDGDDDNEEEEIDFTVDNDGADEHVDIVHPDTPVTPVTRQSRRLQGASPIEGGGVIHRELQPHNNSPRMNFFTAGFTKAVARLERQHSGYMFVSAAVDNYNNMEASKVTPQYHISRGLKIFGQPGVDAVMKELKQLNDLDVISPCKPEDLSREEVKNALPYLMFLKRKRCGKIKGRGCADGRRQREFISNDEASSPTVNLNALFLTCIQEAIEERDVATVDIPGAFLQTDMPTDEPPVHIRLTGKMAMLLTQLDPVRYGPCLFETSKGVKVLYTKANKAIYGTLKAALLFWKKLSGKLHEWGFKANPYDSCTVNKIIDGKQATIVWHVDDLKISHASKDVVTGIITKLSKEFGQVAPLTIRRGKIHDYLGMTIDYSVKGKVSFSMYDYLEDIIATLPDYLKTNRNTTTPAAAHLFNVNPDAASLGQKQADVFHHYVAKLLFAAKRARPDLQTAVAFLCTRVQGPDEDDWKKLIRVLGYLKDTIFLPLILGTDGTNNIYWYVDASFAVHQDMRSHTGATMTMGCGAVLSVSTKQKINTKSSTEAELVGVDDSLPFNLWSLLFLKSQGYHANQCEPTKENADRIKFLGHRNILYQDNTSSIRLETNGKASSTKRTRHINIRYFLITDKVKRGEIEIEYCPTDEMLADYFTKPLQGSLFQRHRNAILGISDADYLRIKDDYFKAKATRGHN
jgi:hypothetical protein